MMSIPKHAMKFGSYYGLSSCVLFAVFSSLGLSQSGIQSWLGYFLMAVFAFLSAKVYRDQENGGFLSFGGAFSCGVQTIFYGSIIVGFFTFLYFKFFDDSLIDKILEQTEQSLADKGMTDVEIEQAMHYSALFTTPPMMGLFTVLGSTFFGALISLVTAAIVKKDNHDFNSFVEDKQE